MAEQAFLESKAQLLMRDIRGLKSEIEDVVKELRKLIGSPGLRSLKISGGKTGPIIPDFDRAISEIEDATEDLQELIHKYIVLKRDLNRASLVRVRYLEDENRVDSDIDLSVYFLIRKRIFVGSGDNRFYLIVRKLTLVESDEGFFVPELTNNYYLPEPLVQGVGGFGGPLFALNSHEAIWFALGADISVPEANRNTLNVWRVPVELPEQEEVPLITEIPDALPMDADAVINLEELMSAYPEPESNPGPALNRYPGASSSQVSASDSISWNYGGGASSESLSIESVATPPTSSSVEISSEMNISWSHTGVGTRAPVLSALVVKYLYVEENGTPKWDGTYRTTYESVTSSGLTNWIQREDKTITSYNVVDPGPPEVLEPVVVIEVRELEFTDNGDDTWHVLFRFTQDGDVITLIEYDSDDEGAEEELFYDASDALVHLTPGASSASGRIPLQHFNGDEDVDTYQEDGAFGLWTTLRFGLEEWDTGAPGCNLNVPSGGWGLTIGIVSDFIEAVETEGGAGTIDDFSAGRSFSGGGITVSTTETAMMFISADPAYMTMVRGRTLPGFCEVGVTSVTAGSGAGLPNYLYRAESASGPGIFGYTNLNGCMTGSTAAADDAYQGQRPDPETPTSVQTTHLRRQVDSGSIFEDLGPDGMTHQLSTMPRVPELVLTLINRIDIESPTGLTPLMVLRDLNQNNMSFDSVVDENDNPIPTLSQLGEAGLTWFIDRIWLGGLEGYYLARTVVLGVTNYYLARVIEGARLGTLKLDTNRENWIDISAGFDPTTETVLDIIDI